MYKISELSSVFKERFSYSGDKRYVIAARQAKKYGKKKRLRRTKYFNASGQYLNFSKPVYEYLKLYMNNRVIAICDAEYNRKTLIEYSITLIQYGTSVTYYYNKNKPKHKLVTDVVWLDSIEEINQVLSLASVFVIYGISGDERTSIHRSGIKFPTKFGKDDFMFDAADFTQSFENDNEWKTSLSLKKWADSLDIKYPNSTYHNAANDTFILSKCIQKFLGDNHATMDVMDNGNTN